MWRYFIQGLAVLLLLSFSLSQGDPASEVVTLTSDELNQITPVEVEYFIPFDEVATSWEDVKDLETLTLEELLQGLGLSARYLDPNEPVDEAHLRVALAGKVYEQRLASWKDPLTLPKTRVNGCSEWLITKVFGGTIKVCLVPKVESSWLQRELVLEITYPGSVHLGDLRQAVDGALRNGATAAAVVVAVSCATGVGCAGGFAAAELAFVTAFKASLGSSLTDQLGIRLVNRSRGWSPWA